MTYTNAELSQIFRNSAIAFASLVVQGRVLNDLRNHPNHNETAWHAVLTTGPVSTGQKKVAMQVASLVGEHAITSTEAARVYMEWWLFSTMAEDWEIVCNLERIRDGKPPYRSPDGKKPRWNDYDSAAWSAWIKDRTAFISTFIGNETEVFAPIEIVQPALQYAAGVLKVKLHNTTAGAALAAHSGTITAIN